MNPTLRPKNPTQTTDEPAPQPEEPDHRHTFVPIQGVPGVNDSEIKVTSIVTISNNALGTNIASYNDGIEAYFNYIKRHRRHLRPESGAGQKARRPTR